MEQAPPNPADESPNQIGDQLRVPQFGIIHLLALTTITAVLLKLNMGMSPGTALGKVPESRILLDRILQTIDAIVTAGGLVGVVALVRARCHIALARLQPGHWLVLIFSFESLLRTLAWASLRGLAPEVAARPSANLFMAAGIAVYFTVAFRAAAFRIQDVRRWGTLLAAMAVFNGLAAVGAIAAIILSSDAGSALLGVTACWWPLASPWAIVVAVSDWRDRLRRDWVHWLGVVVFIIRYGLGLAILPIMALLRLM
ncbi:MAG: hypothetical protein LLG00_12380 [Planctomycetaceae bacterium]|nr:hypothetical protein [Planctomycetaceae bacterium]